MLPRIVVKSDFSLAWASVLSGPQAHVLSKPSLPHRSNLSEIISQAAFWTLMAIWKVSQPIPADGADFVALLDHGSLELPFRPFQPQADERRGENRSPQPSKTKKWRDEGHSGEPCQEPKNGWRDYDEVSSSRGPPSSPSNVYWEGAVHKFPNLRWNGHRQQTTMSPALRGDNVHPNRPHDSFGPPDNETKMPGADEHRARTIILNTIGRRGCLRRKCPRRVLPSAGPFRVLQS